MTIGIKYNHRSCLTYFTKKARADESSIALKILNWFYQNKYYMMKNNSIQIKSI